MKTITGKIIAVKHAKTAIVEVVRKFAHPMYKKLLTKTKTYQVDTEGFTPSVDNQVVIIETRQISKHKYFKIKEIKKQ